MTGPGLISLDRSEPPVVRMNPILQRAVRAAMSPEMLEQAARAAAAALLESWPSPEPGTWLGQSLRASAACLRRATGGLLWTGGCHPLLLRAGQSLDEASLTGPAVDYWAELTAIGDQVFGPGHPESMVTVERLASAYVAAGRVGEAVAWYQRVMADWGKAYGPDHPRTLAARVRLGRVLVTAGLYEDAIAVLTAALTDAERAYGPGHPECAIIRDEVAAGYRAAGELSEAIRLYRLILGDRERGLGAQHPDTMGTRQLLAEAYLADGRVKEAFSQYKKVVGDRQRSQGADHPDTLRARGALAHAYHQAGRMAHGRAALRAGARRVRAHARHRPPRHHRGCRQPGARLLRRGRLSDARRLLDGRGGQGGARRSRPPTLLPGTRGRAWPRSSASSPADRQHSPARRGAPG